jgi:hypothetical protein
MTQATTVCEKHDKAFAGVAAYALVKEGEQIGKVAFKYPQGGAGRLTCYLHFHGVQMVTGTASGYGYDKALAAFESAMRNQAKQQPDASSYGDLASTVAPLAQAFKDAGSAQDWQQVLREQAIQVFKAV